MEIVLVVLVVLLLFGEGYGYSRRADDDLPEIVVWGPCPGGVVGLLPVVVLIILLLRYL